MPAEVQGYHNAHITRKTWRRHAQLRTWRGNRRTLNLSVWPRCVLCGRFSPLCSASLAWLGVEELPLLGSSSQKKQRTAYYSRSPPRSAAWVRRAGRWALLLFVPSTLAARMTSSLRMSPRGTPFYGVGPSRHSINQMTTNVFREYSIKWI